MSDGLGPDISETDTLAELIGATAEESSEDSQDSDADLEDLVDGDVGEE